MTVETHQNEFSPAADQSSLVAAGSPLYQKPIVLVGLMGAGKTTVGRRLASRLGLPFIDSDVEIEKAAGETISEIFEHHGEQVFRAGERRVISRLLQGGAQVLATGGGAFMDEDTRRLIGEKAVSIWLRADLEVLLRRVGRRATRPLLNKLSGNQTQRDVMEALVAARYPIYAEADITVESLEGPHEHVVDEVIAGLQDYCAGHPVDRPGDKP